MGIKKKILITLNALRVWELGILFKEKNLL